LRPVALQDAEAERLLAGMHESKRMAAWHLVDAGGNVHSGGRAIPTLLALLLRSAAPADAARRLQGPIDRAYGLVARNRGTLGRRLRYSAAARADELIAARRRQPSARELTAHRQPPGGQE
jgi:predicted DCC family thiol-disulfide oxidoreductase YuxK